MEVAAQPALSHKSGSCRPPGFAAPTGGSELHRAPRARDRLDVILQRAIAQRGTREVGQRATTQLLQRELSSDDDAAFRAWVCERFKADVLAQCPSRYTAWMRGIRLASNTLGDAKHRFEETVARVDALEIELRAAIAKQLGVGADSKLPKEYDAQIERALKTADTFEQALSIATRALPTLAPTTFAQSSAPLNSIMHWIEQGKTPHDVVKPCVAMNKDATAAPGEDKHILWSGGAGACIIIIAVGTAGGYIKHCTPLDIMGDLKSTVAEFSHVGDERKFHCASQALASSNTPYVEALKKQLPNDAQYHAVSSIAVNVKTRAVIANVDPTGLPT